MFVGQPVFSRAGEQHYRPPCQMCSFCSPIPTLQLTGEITGVNSFLSLNMWLKSCFFKSVNISWEDTTILTFLEALERGLGRREISQGTLWRWIEEKTSQMLLYSPAELSGCYQPDDLLVAWELSGRWEGTCLATRNAWGLTSAGKCSSHLPRESGCAKGYNCSSVNLHKHKLSFLSWKTSGCCDSCLVWYQL